MDWLHTFNNKDLDWYTRISDEVIDAVKNGLITEIINVDNIDNDKNSCLLVACEMEDMYIAEQYSATQVKKKLFLKYFIKFVLNQYKSEFIFYYDAYCPLYYAILRNNIKLVKLLLKYNSKIACIKGTINRILIDIIGNSQAEILKLLIKFGINLDFDILHHACYLNRLSCVILLSNANNKLVKRTDWSNKRPIEIATIYGHLNIVKYLANECYSPLYNSIYYAVENGWMDIVDYLIKGINLKTNDFNPLRIACIKKNIDMVDKILQKNVDLSWIRKKGYDSYIMTAVLNNSLDIIKRLVCYGDDFNYQNNNDKTALYYAYQNKYIDIVDFLIDLGCK